MALAFFLNDPSGLASAFAAHDEYSAILSFYASGGSKTRTLQPGDDYYAAPFCFLPKNDRAGFLVFVPAVPWLHGNPGCAVEDDDGNVEDGTRAHHDAVQWMERRGDRNPPILGTVEEFQRKLCLNEMGVQTFTRDGCYPSKEDISQALEDRAIEVTCRAMGWKIPANWRLDRKPSLHGLRILDLAEWDRRHDKTKNRHDDETVNNRSNNVQIVRKGDDNDARGDDVQEEKKDSPSV